MFMYTHNYLVIFTPKLCTISVLGKQLIELDCSGREIVSSLN